MNTRTREVWPDNIKVFACILVVLGHFFQSMTKAEILPEAGWHMWFDRAIYLFHVQLFFICSGYLYQKYTVILSVKAWGKNIWKKMLVLGIPYFFFSCISWGLKYLWASSVNSAEISMMKMLFIKPMSPYWYLYTLFFVFLIVPSFRTKKNYLLVLALAIIMKAIYVCEIVFPYFVMEALCSNVIWFVSGMGIALIDFGKILRDKKAMVVGGALFVCFCVSSIYVYNNGVSNRIFDAVLCVIACTAVFLIVGHIFADNHQNKFLGFLSIYTMPVFLMHTIFAAGIRIVLLRFGIISFPVHFILGIAGSFIGPVVTMKLLARIPYGDFVVYPGKYLTLK